MNYSKSREKWKHFHFPMKAVLLLSVIFGLSHNSMSQTCSESASVSGNDCSNPMASVNPITCTSGGTITAITMDANIGTWCTSWYGYDIIVNGSTVATNQCNVTGYNLASYLPITSVAIQAHDNDNYCDFITLSMSLNISYVSTPCTNPVDAGAANASSPSVCSGSPVSIGLLNASVGTGLTYQWQSSSNGTSWTNISGATQITYTANPTSATYYRCEVACSGGTPDYSDSTLVSINPFFNCYCVPTNSFGCGIDYINHVNFENISNTGTGCTGAYTDYSATYQTTVFTGSTYNMSVTTDGDDEGIAVWVDYDHSGTFDASELMYSNFIIGTPQTYNFSFAIPTSAQTGLTKMRVRNSYYEIPTSPCANQSYGEAEDYMLNIISPPANDAGIAAINSPSIPSCILDSNICVTLQNFGTDTLTSATIQFYVNNNLQGTYSWTGTVLPQSDDTTCVTIGTYQFQVGDDLLVIASNPNGSSGSYTANDSASMLNMNVSLNGPYSIPGDYATINDAIDAMNAYGVCDDVIFNLANGTYTEHMLLEDVIGMSENATVTFKSANDDTALVTVQFTGNFDTNSVVSLNHGSWFRFKNITFKNLSTSYGRVFELKGQSNHNIVDSCRVIGALTTSTSDYYAVFYSYSARDNYNTFSNNSVEQGSYGFYLAGDGNSTGYHELGTMITNNDITNAYYAGIYAYYQQGMEISKNRITTDGGYIYGYGVYCGDCDNGLDIKYNHIYPTNSGSWPYYGLYTSFCEGSGQGFSTVTNNIVVSGMDAYVGFYQYYSDVMYVANNTFTILGGSSTTTRAYYAYYSDFYFSNNNLCTNFGQGQAAAYLYGVPFEVNHNSYYTMGAQPIYFNGQYFNDLPSYQNTSSLDAASMYVDPMFGDVEAGILCNELLDGAGSPLIYVSDDFEHVTRNPTTPDIGAREFVSLTNFSLAGDTICGSDYEVFGPVNNATWSVDGNQSTGGSVMLNTGSTPQTFNVGISFASVCNVDSITGLPIPVTAAGTYRLIPAANLDAALHLCADDQATLSPGGGANATYVWFPTNETSATITITNGGVYSVTKMEEGCESSATIVVSQSDGVSLLDAEACAGDLPYSANATIVGGMSYAWSTGASTASIDLTTSGSYSVTATDVEGCTSVDTLMFEAIDTPVANITETHTGNYYFFSSATSQNVGSNGTYAWDFGDGSAPSTDPNPQHQFPWTNPSAPTPFTVTLTIINDCGQDVQQTVFTPNVLGVNELNNGLTYKVYPNPSSGLVNIEFSGVSNDQITLKVFDMSGRIVSEKSANTNDIQTLNLENVSAGTYILEVLTNETSSKTRLTIQ